VTNHYTIDTPEGPKLFVPKDDYDGLAAELDSATLELTGACCERNDAHDAMKILAKRIRELEAALAVKSWRCFHCDEVFTDHAAALEHFGESMCDDPACQIDMTDVRAMENQLRQYREEDTALHRELRRMESDHATALRREEEKGYARGLRDAGYVEPGCSPSRDKNLSMATPPSDSPENPR
jgi:hypothetical protein